MISGVLNEHPRVAMAYRDSADRDTYTSQTCPCCQRRKKARTRNYVCVCGYEEHWDIHGARNILAKELSGKMCHIPEETKRKYLWIA
ncbi:TPA: transposase [Bacillus cereus]|nr:transposase [Bacillus cereus]